MRKAFRVWRGKVQSVRVFDTQEEALIAIGGKRGWLVLQDEVVEVVTVPSAKSGVSFRQVKATRSGYHPEWIGGDFRTTKRAAYRELARQLRKQVRLDAASLYRLNAKLDKADRVGRKR